MWTRGTSWTEAEVRRAYLSLIWPCDRLEILDKSEKIWQRSAGIALICYGSGAGCSIRRNAVALNWSDSNRRGWPCQSRYAFAINNRID